MSGNNKESLLSFDEKVQARKDHMALLDAKRAVSQKEQAARNEALKLAIAKEKRRKIAAKAAMKQLDGYDLTTPFLGVRAGESLENIAKFKMDIYDWNTPTETETSEKTSSPEELGYASLNN